MQIDIQKDCGNSPKQKFVQDFNVAFANADVSFLAGCVSEDIHWEIVGDKTIHGKSAFVQAVSEMAEHPASRLVLHQVVTHGKLAASNGVMYLKNEPDAQYCFSDMYQFVSAGKNIIQSMKSYVIKCPGT